MNMTAILRDKFAEEIDRELCINTNTLRQTGILTILWTKSFPNNKFNRWITF